MKTVFYAATAAACIALTAPAFAQDGTTFTGPHAEVFGGYDALKTGRNGLGTPDGFTYGLGLGYDAQVGGAILGVEGEVADATTKRNFTNGEFDADRDLYVGARAGVPIGAKTLAYVKAGYTNARVETSDGFAKNLDGYRLGAGLEYKLSGNVFVKGEYRYSNYEDDYSRHQVLGGIGIRF